MSKRKGFIIFSTIIFSIIIGLVIFTIVRPYLRFSSPEMAFGLSGVNESIRDIHVQDDIAIIATPVYYYVLRDERGWISRIYNNPIIKCINVDLSLPNHPDIWYRKCTDGINMMMIFKTFGSKTDLEITDSLGSQFIYFETNYGEGEDPGQCWYTVVENFDDYVLTINGHDFPME